MKHLNFLTMLLALLMMGGCEQRINVKYPETVKVANADTYFGVRISDPYRWLENDTSKETAAWVRNQNLVTYKYLSQISIREKIREKLTKIWNFPKYRVPFKQGPYYFFFKNDGLQNQYVLYFRTGMDKDPKVLLDPNSLSTDGTVALSSFRVSTDGRYLAYNITKSGSEKNDVYVMEVLSQKNLPDHLHGIKISGLAWRGDGFYYSCYPELFPGRESTGKNENEKIWYHKLGADQKDDRLVYENTRFPQHNCRAWLTNDERFLFIYESESATGNALLYQDLSKNREGLFLPLFEGFDFEYNVIDNIGDKLLVMTNRFTPRKKLVMVDPANPKSENWKVIIPERDDVLGSVILTGEKIVSIYEQMAVSRALIYDLDGKFIEEISLPGLGTITGFNGRKGDNIAFFGYTTFRYPTEVFKYDVSTNQATAYSRPEIDFDPDQFEAKQVSYMSRDRTTITMFLVYKKGLQLDGQNPTMLYGYGGFNYSVRPSFNISRTIFLDNGGIFAVPNLRGGGEYGEEWHRAGMKEKKQNTIDDMIAAAEYLISENYTNPDKLAIMGNLNGGMLVGACITQRPDLFKVAIPQSGVMDMLRYHNFTIGWTWKNDYGTSETFDGFNYLVKYSPLQNIKKGTSYPATLAFTAEHDDRVVPSHTYKFISALQEATKGPNPILARIDTTGVLRGGTPTSKQILENTDLWSFVFYNLGMKLK